MPINLLPLTVKQALQDLADFITEKKKTILGLTKVIVFGGSYAGSLAAWSRLKFPDLIYGAVSSSGTFNTVVDGYGMLISINKFITSNIYQVLQTFNICTLTRKTNFEISGRNLIIQLYILYNMIIALKCVIERIERKNFRIMTLIAFIANA